MKQINISKERVLQLMHNFLEDGCYIPFTTIGNGSAGLQCLLNVDDIQEFPNFDMTGLIADSDLNKISKKSHKSLACVDELRIF